MVKYIYVDESGDLGFAGTKYFVLAALLVNNPRELNRIIKNMRRNKFKKELKDVSEIKADKSSNEVRTYMLSKLNMAGSAKILYIVLEKKKVYSDYLKNDKHKLYNYVAGKLAKHISLDESDVEIRVDKSKGKQLLRDDFDNYFKSNLKEGLKATIYHSYSHSWSGLQFADMLAWACFQKFEHTNSEFIDLIKLEQEVCHVW